MPPRFDPTLVPDPFAPLLAEGAPRPRQRIARARILAAARRLLARAPAKFTLRGVADECGVTAQTLRNNFGRREELLTAAFNDHTSAVWRALGHCSSGPFLFLDLAQMYHACAVASPDFLRAMVTSAMAELGPLAVAEKHGSTIKAGYLRALLHGAVLRPGVDPALLAGHITRLNTFMMYEWAMRGDAATLRRAMIDGNRLLLLGAVAARHAPAIEAWRPAAAA